MAQDVLITPASTKIAFTDSGDTTTVLRTSSGRFEFKDSGESSFVDLYANDIVLDGNLTVGGTTTTVNTSSVLIEDPILQSLKSTNVLIYRLLFSKLSIFPTPWIIPANIFN